MGEYARYRGQDVKIGTCENMYYLRADQAALVTALHGSVDPMSARDRESIRFRFPFPAEDGIEPGRFEHPLPDLIVNYPAELPAEHGDVSVETGAQSSRRMSAFLPCPMKDRGIWHQYVRAFAPAVRISYQGYRGDGNNLAVIVSCAYCDGMWNIPEWEQAEQLVVSIRSQADALHRQGGHRREDTLRRHGPDVSDPMAEREIAQAAELHTVADRITAGYAASVKS